MKNLILNEFQQDHHTNSQRQRYQLPDAERAEDNMRETEPRQRMIDETLQKHGDTSLFWEYLQEQQSSSLIHQEEAPSCISRRGEEQHKPPHSVNQMVQDNALRSSPDDTLPKSIDVTSSKRCQGTAADDPIKGSIVFDHLSEHRTKLTLLDTLREAANIAISSKGKLELAQDDATREEHNPIVQGNEKKGSNNIYDYLAEHRARMDRLSALQIHKEQSNMYYPRNEWDDDDDLDSRHYDDDDEYNGIDELIFEIEL